MLKPSEIVLCVARFGSLNGSMMIRAVLVLGVLSGAGCVWKHSYRVGTREYAPTDAAAVEIYSRWRKVPHPYIEVGLIRVFSDYPKTDPPEGTTISRALRKEAARFGAHAVVLEFSGGSIRWSGSWVATAIRFPERGGDTSQ